MSVYKQLRNYLTSLVVLYHSYFALNGWVALFVTAFAAGMGALQPIPYALLAQAVVASTRGEGEITIPHVTTLPLELGFYLAVTLLLLNIVGKYLLERLAVWQNIQWQNGLFWKIISGSGRMAKPYYRAELPFLPNEKAFLSTTLLSLRSTIILGRLITVGLNDLVTALVALLILASLDVSGLVVIAVIVVSFLPIYARVAVGLATVRQRKQRRWTNLSRDARSLIAYLGQDPPRRRVVAGDTAARHQFEPLYSVMNVMLGKMANITFVAGLNLVVIVLGIFVWNGASVSVLLHEKLSYFVVLLLFLRSSLVLSSLLGRVTRNYMGLSLLREFIQPRPKAPSRDATAPADAQFKVSGTDGRTLFVGPGTPVYVLMPPLRLPCGLIALSNGLVPLVADKKVRDQYLTLITPEALSDFDTHMGRKTPGFQNAETDGTPVSLRPDPEGDWRRQTAIVIAEPQWQAAVKSGLANEIGAGRTVFILIEPGDQEAERDARAPLIASDGQTVIAAGPFGDCFSAAVDTVARAAARNRRSLEDDDDSIE